VAWEQVRVTGLSQKKVEYSSLLAARRSFIQSNRHPSGWISYGRYQSMKRFNQKFLWIEPPETDFFSSKIAPLTRSSLTGRAEIIRRKMAK
jgi:hypothetical protein